MRRTLHVEVQRPEGAALEGAMLLAPRPFQHWGQRFDGFETDGAEIVGEIEATNSKCRAYLIRPTQDVARLSYAVSLGDPYEQEFCACDWAWELERNRYTMAAPSLLELAQKVAIGATSEREALRRIVEDAAAVFSYGHAPERFNDACDAVPKLCGTTQGSCVDINTYILAAALAIGIKGQYVAGYWLHPEKTETHDMHCWLAFEPDGELVFWDLAHGMKWAATLGARIEEGLNPAGGRRIAMSCGRGLRFETPVGAIESSHFAEPIWLTPEGEALDPEIIARVEEPEGARAQLGSIEKSKEEVAP